MSEFLIVGEKGSEDWLKEDWATRKKAQTDQRHNPLFCDWGRELARSVTVVESPTGTGTLLSKKMTVRKKHLYEKGCDEDSKTKNTQKRRGTSREKELKEVGKRGYGVFFRTSAKRDTAG